MQQARRERSPPHPSPFRSATSDASDAAVAADHKRPGRLENFRHGAHDGRPALSPYASVGLWRRKSR
jgi:hypothetical protein